MGERYYYEIRDDLIAHGLREVIDFSSHFLFEKKVCLIHANCHGEAIIPYLKQCSDFIREYSIYPWEGLILSNKEEIGDRILKCADVFIFQIIGRDNHFGEKYASDYCLGCIKEDCIKVCVPNFYPIINAFFPMQTVEQNDLAGSARSRKMFFRDKLLDEGYERYGEDIASIREFAENYSFDGVDIKRMFEAMMSLIKERDNMWDIKVYDYIMANYKTKSLFHDIGHPDEELMIYICRGICDILGLGYPSPEIERKCMPDLGFRSIVWDGARKILDLSFPEKLMRIERSYRMLEGAIHLDSEEIDRDEYIREYFFAFH